MADVGQINKLRVLRQAPFGLFLDGGASGEILLPAKFVPDECQEGDELEVFVYHDSEDRLVATTQQTRVCVGQFGYLKVVSVTANGAFLDWGLDKDLFVPLRQQQQRMQEGKSYIVYANLDQDGRAVATSKIDKFLDVWPARYEQGVEVSLLIANQTDLGCKVIVNHRHWGLIHNQDIFKKLRYGAVERGFIKRIREDGKIDVSLRPLGHNKINDLAEKILLALRDNEGFLPLHDKSSPEEIKRILGESKKNFKNAIGVLYKQQKIDISDTGIKLKA